MGTTIFPTDKTAGQILQDELCGEGSTIRMFTTCGDSAAVALSVDLTKISDDWRAHILRTYELPDNATRAIVGIVVKHSGLNGRGRRSVSIKVMGEEGGPYYTGGATAELLGILSPLRAREYRDDDAYSWALGWRERCWDEIKARRVSA